VKTNVEIFTTFINVYVGEENKIIAMQREEDFSNGREVESDSCAAVAAHITQYTLPLPTCPSLTSCAPARYGYKGGGH
jgi:hypothetical protein